MQISSTCAFVIPFIFSPYCNHNQLLTKVGDEVDIWNGKVYAVVDEIHREVKVLIEASLGEGGGRKIVLFGDVARCHPDDAFSVNGGIKLACRRACGVGITGKSRAVSAFTARVWQAIRVALKETFGDDIPDVAPGDTRESGLLDANLVLDFPKKARKPRQVAGRKTPEEIRKKQEMFVAMRAWDENADHLPAAEYGRGLTSFVARWNEEHGTDFAPRLAALEYITWDYDNPPEWDDDAP